MPKFHKTPKLEKCIKIPKILILVFNQSSPVNPVSESRVGRLSVTE